jgi:DNA-binding NarL/FixJ family response regulator
MLVPVAPTAPARAAILRAVVLSQHRLVPLALGAAGKAESSFEVIGAATDFHEAMEWLHGASAHVLVFDPTALSLGRIPYLVEAARARLMHPQGIVLLLEPAQSATVVAARFAFGQGVRVATTSLDDPSSWPMAIHAACRGAKHLSSGALDLLGEADEWREPDYSDPWLAPREKSSACRDLAAPVHW